MVIAVVVTLEVSAPVSLVVAVTANPLRTFDHFKEII
jgi:hypothetical protein